jgi:hypothetical protein
MKLITSPHRTNTLLRRLLCCVAVIVLAAPPGVVNAWGVRTHLWIGQQVLNDVLDDDHVTIVGRRYPVPTHVLRALREKGSRYLMGHLGPDVFPDPIVGQTTTHPGIEGGWQTDQWLNQLLRDADVPGEIAFAYGFAGHASGDIFAHSYVNAYAGSVFDLSNPLSQGAVERRHVVLEKYIESLMPVPRDLSGRVITVEDAETTTSFLRDQLVLNRDASRQYAGVPTAAHLNAMFNVRRVVVNAEREYGKVIDRVTEWGAQYLQESIKLTSDLASARAAVEAAQIGVNAQREALRIASYAHEVAKKRLLEVNEIVQKNPALINAAERLYVQQVKIAVDAAAEAASVAANVDAEVRRLEDRVNTWLDKLGGFRCGRLFEPAKSECKKRFGKLEVRISDAQEAITLRKQRRETFRNLAREADRARDNSKRELDRLREQYERAKLDLARGTLQAAVNVTDAQFKAAQQAVEVQQQMVDEAENVQRNVARELNRVNGIVDEFQGFLRRYNPVTLVLNEWIKKIDQAGEEYIKAGHRAGVMMATNSGNPIGEYTRWWDCYGSVFTGVPGVSQLGCEIKNYLDEAEAQVFRAIDRLPEYLRWVITPSREASKVVRREVTQELAKLGPVIAEFIFGPTMGDFLSLLVRPENATRSKLISVYQEDGSRLQLIRFDNVAALVDRDLALRNGEINPEQLAPLAHSVTLAKLSLLAPEQINQLVQDLAGPHVSPKYGAPLYPPYHGNFTLLLDAVRSIDGNHQWQAFGLPHPRRLGVQHDNPDGSQFGHNYYDNPGKGLRIWVDPFLRDRVFLRLFPTPVLGALAERPELQWPAYRFPSCAANPFPSTQDRNGKVIAEDRTCVDQVAGSSGPDLPFKDTGEYKARYFLCQSPMPGSRSVVVHRVRHVEQVEKHVCRLTNAFPDMRFTTRFEKGKWSVVAGECLQPDRAAELTDVLLRRGIGDQYSAVD